MRAESDSVSGDALMNGDQDHPVLVRQHATNRMNRMNGMNGMNDWGE